MTTNTSQTESDAAIPNEPVALTEAPAATSTTVTLIERGLWIESLDLEGQGIARAGGKVIFVEGALPGERVEVETTKRKASYEKARAVAWYRKGYMRVTPRCPHFGVCGGCAMQHVDPNGQVAIKQRSLEDTLWHIGKLKPETVLPPLSGPAWGYRHRARMTVRVVAKKGGALVGFHERGSSFVADMNECHVLPPKISDLLPKLRRLVDQLSIATRLPQIEVAVGESSVVLVMRVLEPPSEADRALFAQFQVDEDVLVWLQPKGPDTIVPLIAPDPDDPRAALPLHYSLPEFNVVMPFAPTEFTQVNFQMNRAMVARALRLLGTQKHERVLDLFCGLGNFTLPLARTARQVIGIEGSPALIRRAQQNAALNGLSERTDYRCANLFEMTLDDYLACGPIDRLLIDPPREGALAVANVLVALPAAQRPQRIVYVSCNPATLARDARVLVHDGGYRLVSAGAMNMFPHTAHVESIAVFECGS